MLLQLPLEAKPKKMTDSAVLQKKVDDLQSTVNRLSQQIDHYFTSGVIVSAELFFEINIRD